MHFRNGTAALLGGVVALGACSLAGCGEDTARTTGTVVDGKAPGQDEGQKASMDAMKAMMKSQGGN